MITIYYDLSELFLLSGQKFKYYGISRTVMEVGYELAMMDGVSVRFVAFSPARKRFFEVNPPRPSDPPDWGETEGSRLSSRATPFLRDTNPPLSS
jgi:hypothetical protein